MESCSRTRRANARRWLWLGLLIVGAICTPPDLFSQMAIVLPLVFFWKVFGGGYVFVLYDIPIINNMFLRKEIKKVSFDLKENRGRMAERSKATDCKSVDLRST